MQNLIFSLNATLPVFLVMVVGYALGQLGFLPPAFCKASDRLTFKVTLPLMLFLDMGSVDILHDFQPRFVMFCFAATLVGILTVWAGAKRFLKDKTRWWASSCRRATAAAPPCWAWRSYRTFTAAPAWPRS